MNNNNNLILIVGLQKSGTFLLKQLLVESQLAADPFQGEGDDFWGNLPPFTPRAYPAGTIYQRSKGKMGHEIEGHNATDDINECLNQRLRKININSGIVVNKNPYNSVRIPWLRKLFPESLIVGIVRKPVPNVFSLLKRFTYCEGYKYEPEAGWWGVKPKNWQELIHDNKIIQCAQQWRAVNEKMIRNRDLLDLIVTYHDLCRYPMRIVNKILSLALKQEVSLIIDYPPIKCFDGEYKVGSRLLSKKRAPDGTAVLDTSWLEQEKIEIQKLQVEDIAIIDKICEPVYRQYSAY